jgi:P-type Mg2+ transporter
MEGPEQSYWSTPADKLLEALGTSRQGLSASEARQRLNQTGLNLLRPRTRTDSLTLLANQFRSPLVLVLIGTAAASFFLGGAASSTIILAIVFISGLLGFWQERTSTNAIQGLLSLVRLKITALRDASPKEIPFEDVVPGDIIELSAGTSMPADCLLLESKDLFVDEAALTGETFPAEKTAGTLPPDTPSRQRTNALFMGTHVVTGSGTAVVIVTGSRTEFGKISEHLRLRPPETDFELGVRRFGYFLINVTLVLVIAIFVINVFLARPVLESMLFSVALAVGLTPQLLPAIISINLSHGARQMAKEKVIVKRLASIENFGSMNVLCSDKTGTLTEGTMDLQSNMDAQGKESERVKLYAYLNAFFETGFANPVDEAIRRHSRLDVQGYVKLDEVPYDFLRKRLSILVRKDEHHLMVTKGTLPVLFNACSQVEMSDGKLTEIAELQAGLQNRFEELNSQGFRTLGIAYRNMGQKAAISKQDEADMIFLGFIILSDPPKKDIKQTITHLETLGITLKVISGDNSLVTAHVCREIGLPGDRMLTGSDLHKMKDQALMRQVNEVNLFAEIEPNQKERIILALRKSGNVVGYIGDGINDSSALHAADVGISVDSAVDVAKEAADIVLMEKDLAVLADGVKEGRTTFVNTLKYVFMATSANFGNMFSMAGASLFLPFLPLMPTQILLTNLLTDVPETTIATDNVDRDLVIKPRRWNITFIRKFMLVFGLLSSVFDYLTFGALLFWLHSSETQFRTGWFVESVVSASVVVLVIRTQKPLTRSRPGRYLFISTVLIASITMALPYTPLATILGFTPLPLYFMAIVIVVVAAYISAAEIAKHFFYRHITL